MLGSMRRPIDDGHDKRGWSLTISRFQLSAVGNQAEQPFSSMLALSCNSSLHPSRVTESR